MVLSQPVSPIAGGAEALPPLQGGASYEAAGITAGLDLLPIPAALVTVRQNRVVLEAVNRPFRASGLGEAGNPAAPLLVHCAERIHAFLLSDDVRELFDWSLGESVDSRFFRVLLARRSVCHRLPRCLVTLIDRTPELRTEQSLRREMATDSLTGLPNRAGFDDRLEELVTQETSERYAVLAVDLLRFSRVNACMGSVVGDELLISVARRLKGALRAHDVLARTGGDEFAILLRLSASEDAEEVASRVRGILSGMFRLSEFDVQVDCAIGIAFAASGTGATEELIRQAQFAMKHSKRSGRTEIYQPQALETVRAEFSIEAELRRAVEAGALHLHFQPICDLDSRRITTFEALARWRTTSGEEIPPSRFIPVAEESGLIVQLGRWALDEAARTLALWDRVHGGNCGVNVAVNLSAVQLQRDPVATVVEQALGRHRVDPRRLTLELTESAIVSDPESAAAAMRALKALGTTLAMDDFGTGYSNLAYLQRLPIDILKIDRSFVSGMLADRDKVAIVRAILSLAQALGMRTTAEGVESSALEHTLAALGCHFGQGFFYARPLSGDDAYRLLVERNA